MLNINGKRLRQSLEIMAEIGATPGGGVQRLSLTDEDKAAREQIISWMREVELDVKVDEMGNIFGIRNGRNNDLSPVMTGSHCDTQPKGGRFDGILGVIGGLEVLRILHENNIETQRPVILAVWTNEEGFRFSPAMVSSGVWAGKLELEWAYRRTDLTGAKLGDELERIGYKGDMPAVSRPIYAHYELHIEQGPILEKENKTIGVPKGVLCLHWYDVYIEGEANQVGPTPMAGRHDALCAASEMILKVNELPSKMGGNMVATVGEIHNMPNSRNIIPDKVHFTVDIRSWDDVFALKAWENLRGSFINIADARGCQLKTEISWRVEHALFNQELARKILEKAGKRNYSSLYMVSGAGHDASYINQVAPTSMIFVPSIGGRSHVEVEDTKWEDCEAGANVLLDCIIDSSMEI
ncbi:MAG: M20 family metallo-hydrolase [Victivallales bacterium]|nr:M20 family metallo-hydrolase [Victivallales bacterium]MCF7888926.1 M20 family metallo-hydrolase [Victivallales bacterium]